VPALNFQKQFAVQIKSGAKRCTIRAPRKREIRAGDTLHLFTGIRTKACQKLKVAKCRRAVPIKIATDSYDQSPVIEVNGHVLSVPSALSLARRDGHPTLASFIAFFEAIHGLPFAGTLISW
jgi:hypothetical protein